jgi:hypothetical protein
MIENETEQLKSGICRRLETTWRPMEEWLRRTVSRIPLDNALLLGFSVLLFLRCYPAFAPMPSQINAHDEASYIQGGFDMVHGKMPSLANHPAVSMLFAAAYLVFQNSALWFIQSEWLVRCFLFALLWGSIRLLSHILKDDLPEWSILALWALVLFPSRLLDNPSQLLFTILLTLAIGQCLLLRRDGRVRHALAVSFLLGAAFLTRDEGLWIWILTLPCVLLLTIHGLTDLVRHRIASIAIALAACLIPFIALILMYVGWFYGVTGTVNTRLSDRTYDALEAGQGLSFPERYQGDLYISGIADARRIYGDRAANNNSVLLAALRHPLPMLERIARNSLAMPSFAIQANGGLVGILLLLFMLGGIADFARQKAWGTLGIFFSFSLYLVLFIPFFWLTDYFLFLFPVIFYLAAKGICATLAGRLSWIWVVFGFMAVIGIPAGLLQAEFRTAYAGLAILAFLVITAVADRDLNRRPIQLAALGIVLLIMARPTYATNPQLIPNLSSDFESQAAVWLMHNSQPTDTIAGWGATVPYMASRPFLSLEGYLNSPSALYKWLRENSIQFVYQNPDVRGVFPDVYQTIFDLEADGCLVEKFADTTNTARIYQTQTACGLTS